MPQTHIPLCANPLFSDILSLLEPPRLDTVSFEPVLAPSISPASPASPYSFEPTQRNKQQRSPYPPLFVFLSCSLSHLFCTTKPDIPEILEMTKQFNIFYPNSQMPTGLSRQEGRQSCGIGDNTMRPRCGRGKRCGSRQLFPPCPFPEIVFSAVWFFVVVAVSVTRPCVYLSLAMCIPLASSLCLSSFFMVLTCSSVPC
jgi:hypothetical protein